MLGYIKSPKTPQVSHASYKFKGFVGIDASTPGCTSSLEYCSYGYNFTLSLGVMREGIGIDEAKYTVNGEEIEITDLSTRSQRILRGHWFPHKDPETDEEIDEILTYGNAHTLYAHPLLKSGTYKQVSVKHGTVPGIEFVNYYTGGSNKALCYLGSGGLIVYDGTSSVSYDDVPGFCSVCMVYDRVFGVDYEDRNKIHFSAQFSPEKFSEEDGGGYISLMDEGGKILKIVSYSNAIYVFREYAVNKISVYGSPSDYVVSKLFSSGDRIAGGSVATDGNRLVFIAGKKLYVYDIDGLKTCFEGVMALVEDSTDAVSMLSAGRYFLSVKLKTEGEKIGDEASDDAVTRNGILVIDVLTGKYFGVFRGTDVAEFIPVYCTKFRAIFVVFGNSRSTGYGIITDDGMFMGETLPKLWRSPTVCIGSAEKVKRLRRIYIKSYGNAKITVTMSGTPYQKYVFGSPRCSIVIFKDAIGEDISMEISSEAPAFHFEPPELVFDLNRRYV